MFHKRLTLEQVPPFCQGLAPSLKAKTAILLTGALGAGKTYFVKELLKALGGEEALSPTFSLINAYQSCQPYSLYHVDLYRLESSEDLETSGFWDLFADKNSVVLIEWASKIKKDELPLDWKTLCVDIHKVVDDENVREYRVTPEIS